MEVEEAPVPQPPSLRTDDILGVSENLGRRPEADPEEL